METNPATALILKNIMNEFTTPDTKVEITSVIPQTNNVVFLPNLKKGLNNKV